MKKIKILTITLIIALVTMVAFVGIYTQNQNRMENKIKTYNTAMDLNGTRRISLKVAEAEETEEETEEEETEETKTVENYQKAKKIMEERLKTIGIQNYLIRLNKTTGEMVVELPEDEATDTAVSYLGTVGKFEIKDTQTGDVLMDNTDIKLANVLYGQDQTSGTTVYLNIEFTKDGAEKYKEISKTYVTEENDAESDAENDTEEDTQTEETETEEKTITMMIDEEEILTTSFDEPIEIGKLQLSIGRATTDSQTFQGYYNQANNIAILLDSGNLPVKYEVESNQYVLPSITEKHISIIIYVMTAIVVVALIILIVRYKSQGAVTAIAYIGLISIFLLLIRYTNIILSLEGILGIAVVLALNYLFTVKLLSKIKKETLSKSNVRESMKEAYKEFFIKIVPICIMSVIFCFIKWTPISSFGMVMFWGIALIAVYNFIVTNNMMQINASK